MMLARSSLARVLLPSLLAIGLLGGCSDRGTDDLQRYVDEIKARQKPRVEPLPEFVPYETFIYQAQNLRDPFTPPSFSQASASVSGSTSAIHPDFDRPREPLEEFPLDSLRMVGTLEQHEDSWGLVKDSDGSIHRVQPGHYLGQNHGKIIRVTEQVIDINEIVPDGLGGWIERQASLALSE